MEPYKTFYSEFLNFENARISGSEYTLSCPFHEDNNPSFSVNLESGVWICHVGCGGGGPHSFIDMARPQLTLEENRKYLEQVLGKELLKEFKKEKVKVEKKAFPYTEEHVQKCMEDLQSNPKALEVVQQKWKLTPEILGDLKIGIWAGRFAFPIYVNGKLVNIRQYAANPHPNQPKIKGVMGHNEMQLYPYDLLKDAYEVWLMEGEKDMLRARANGLNAFTVTSGAGAFNNEWLELFRNKKVNICYDIDKVGVLGANKVASKLKPYVDSLKIIELPITTPENGDFSDYLDQGKTIPELLEIVENTINLKETEPHIDEENQLDPEVTRTTLEGAFYEGVYFRRILMPLRIVGRIETPYMLPDSVRISCSKPLKQKNCLTCANNTETGIIEFTIDERVFNILKLIDCSDAQQMRALLEMCGVYDRCPCVKITPIGQQFIELIAVSPTIDDLDVNQISDTKPMYMMKENLTVNEEFFIEAVVIKNPENQKIAQLGYKSSPCKSSVQKFVLTPEIREELKIWQVSQTSNLN